MADKIPQLIQHEPLATELLREVKASGKRWFIIALVELFLILALAGGFIWYITLPTEEYVIDQDANENSYNQVVGGDYNGGASENLVQTESSED